MPSDLTPERSAEQVVREALSVCICNKNPATMDGPDRDCPTHGDAQGQAIAVVAALRESGDLPGQRSAPAAARKIMLEWLYECLRYVEAGDGHAVVVLHEALKDVESWDRNPLRESGHLPGGKLRQRWIADGQLLDHEPEDWLKPMCLAVFVLDPYEQTAPEGER